MSSTKPILGPILGPILRAHEDFVGGSPDVIKALFANGEQGSYYNIQDTSTMFQDAAGTTPAVVGQVVGLVQDQSGNGNHATQNTTASKPILRQNASGHYYLEFDGFDDFLTTAATLNLAATDKLTIFAGLRKLSDAAAGFVAGNAVASTGSVGDFSLYSPLLSDGHAFRIRGSGLNSSASFSNAAAPDTAVLTVDIDMARADGFQGRGRRNQSAFVDGGAGAGNGAFRDATLYVGRRGTGTLPFSGHLYALVIRGATTAVETITAVENEINSYTEAF